MITQPDSCHRAAENPGARRRALPGLLVALLGLFTLAGASAASGGTIATNAVQQPTTATAAAGDAALLRSAIRLLGLQTPGPLTTGEADDDPTGASTHRVALRPLHGHDRAAAHGDFTPVTPRRLRPLHGVPQSPRAPPLLA